MSSDDDKTGPHIRLEDLMPSDTQVYEDKRDRNVSHVYARPGRKVVVHTTSSGDAVGVVDVPSVPAPPEGANGEWKGEP